MKTKNKIIHTLISSCLLFSFLLINSCDKNEVKREEETTLIGEKVLIKANGANFGQGPEVKFWFSGRNINNHTVVDMENDPEIGKYANNSASSEEFPWEYWADSKSGRSFVPTINNKATSGASFRGLIDMGNASSELDGYLISYRTYVPDNYSFPGTSLTQFANKDFTGCGSSYKSAWVSYNGDNTTDGDLVIWTHMSGGNIGFIGNGAQVQVKEKSDSYSIYATNLGLLSTSDHSPRVLAYLKVPEDFASGSKVTTEWSFVSTNSHTYHHGQRPMTSNKVPLNHRYIVLLGWSDPDRNGFGNVATTQVLCGDIYVAQGPNARARIELGDAPNYEDCNWLFIAPPENWSENEVQAYFYNDEIAKCKYWFITTSDGTRYSGSL